MPETTTVPSPWFRIFSVVAFIVLVIAGYFFYTRVIVPQENYAASANFFSGPSYQNALTAIKAGNYSKSAESFGALQNETPRGSIAQYAVSYGLASSLAGTGDFCSAASQYKALAANPNGLPPQFPSFALDGLGALTDAVMDNPTIVRSCIFNDPPYNGYLQAANGNILQAEIALFKKADTLYPSSFSKYEIAHKEGRLVYAYVHATSSPPVSQDEKVALAKDIQAQAAAGDELISDPVLSQMFGQALYIWPMWYLIRAGALDASNDVLHNLSENTMYNNYEEALSFVAATPNEAMAEVLGINTRLFYAASFARHDGVAAKDKINSLLSYLKTAQAGSGVFSSEAFVKFISFNQPGTNPMKDEFSVLAADSPDFKTFLERALQMNVGVSN
ncbi:MAG: hypothetical protein KGI71_02480 [Patescibacteria group bacterium]|nr:hypothetical protein [Patescibacteria group bacterium]